MYRQGPNHIIESSLMINGGFTIPEFVELLVASALAGLLAGCLLIYIHHRFLRHCCLRPQDFEHGTKVHHSSGGDASMIDIWQQTPTIPIQIPPPDEYAMPPLEPEPEHAIPQVETGYPSTSHQILDKIPGSQPFMVNPAIDHPTPRAFSRNDYQGKISISNYHDHDRGMRNTTNVDLSSRTPTTTSTPPHNVRASGSPRYLAF